MNDYLQIRELYHWGIKGQKWGVRRYQNEDGTLTEEGKKRYNKFKEEVNKQADDSINKGAEANMFRQELQKNPKWQMYYNFEELADMQLKYVNAYNESVSKGAKLVAKLRKDGLLDKSMSKFSDEDIYKDFLDKKADYYRTGYTDDLKKSGISDASYLYGVTKKNN